MDGTLLHVAADSASLGMDQWMIHCVEASQSMALTGHAENRISMWDLDTGRSCGSINCRMHDAGNADVVTSLQWTDAEHVLLSSHFQGGLCLSDTRTRQPVQMLHISGAAGMWCVGACA